MSFIQLLQLHLQNTGCFLSQRSDLGSHDLRQLVYRWSSPRKEREEPQLNIRAFESPSGVAPPPVITDHFHSSCIDINSQVDTDVIDQI